MILKSNQIAILADDMTGAFDVAACFCGDFASVPVYIDPQAEGIGSEDGVFVVNLGTRNAGSTVSREVASDVRDRLKSRDVIFLKVDSAMRGYVGDQIAGLLSGAGRRQIVICPAIPAIGRTVENGIILQSGVRINEGPYANDIIRPVSDCDISLILSNLKSSEYVIHDAKSNSDLENIVACTLTETKVLFVGSLGLADAVAKYTEKSVSKPVDAWKCSRPAIICGSKYDRAKQQMDGIKKEFKGRFFEIVIGNKKGYDVVPKSELILIEIEQEQIKITPQERLNLISAIVKELCEKGIADGLGIIGGDTAHQVLQSLGVTKVNCTKRICEIISCGHISEGDLVGMPYVSKGGSVGGEAAGIAMVKYLKGMENQ